LFSFNGVDYSFDYLNCDLAIEDTWDSEVNYRTEENDVLGLDGEKRAAASLRTIFKVKDGFEVIGVKQTTTLAEYKKRKGIDIIIKYKGKTVIVIEVKNWNIQPKPYGYKTYLNNIKPHFENIALDVTKVLVITYPEELLSQKTKTDLEHNNIVIIDAKELLVQNFFSNLRQNLYTLSARIKKALAPTFLCSLSVYSSLDNYSNIQSFNYIGNNITTTEPDSIDGTFEIEPLIRATILENLSLLAIENG
jgi:hypothetical protein